MGSCLNSPVWAGQSQAGVYFDPGPSGGIPTGTPTWVGTLLANGGSGGGLLYRRNRYYDPATGQFTQEDPIGFGGGTNLYGFANGDPVNATDPFGLCTDPKDPDCIGEQVRDYVNTKVDQAISLLGDLGNALKSKLSSFAKHALLEIGLALVTGGESEEAEGAVTLFRAVGGEEAADLEASGAMRIAKSSAEGKYFAESAADAGKWGEKFYGAGNFSVIEARFPADVAKQMVRWDRLDGIGAARFATPDVLKYAAWNFIH